MKLKYSISFFLVPVFCFMFGISDGMLQTYDFKSLCPSGKGNATINIGTTSLGSSSSFILRAFRDSLGIFNWYDWDINCTVLIIPPPSHSIVVSVKNIELRRLCVDNLTLSDSAGNVHTYCNTYSSEEERESKNFIGTLTVTFRTAGFLFETPMDKKGFTLTVTSYRSSFCFLTSSDFRCNNARCISKELRCDGHNHCGDRSDQLNCVATPGPIGIRTTPTVWIYSTKSSTSAGKIIGAVFGCFFLFVAIIASMMYYKSKGRRIVTRTIINQQAPYTITHVPPSAPTQPAFSAHLPRPQASHHGNPYPPLSKEVLDHPPPYSEVVK